MALPGTGWATVDWVENWHAVLASSYCAAHWRSWS